ncbi:MAG: Fic family protein [Bacteroidota bacterium]|nr:Fic family protein [Bacteroidota bacterium]
MAETLDFSKEIIFSSSDPAISRKITKAEKEGKLKKLAPRIYTTNLIDTQESIIKRNLIEILAWRYPNAVISHRSAQELRPTREGEFFLTFSYRKKISDLPGLILNISEGPKAVESDIFLNGIYIASEYRWMLECMQVSKRKGEQSKVLPVSFIEERLGRMILVQGENKLNEFRDKLREVSVQLSMQSEFNKLNAIISALLATHNVNVLSSDFAKARATGVPYDGARVELFSILFDALKDRFFVERPNKNTDESSFRLFSFFESYFSNYIEGTKFSIDEAKSIIDTGIVIPKRVKDSHDILGTFAIISNRSEMNKVPTTYEELFDLLQNRHRVLMREREDCNPGFFKEINNQAGNTLFVDHTLVKGTLQHSFKYYSALKEPMARALFMMFMISEVHPFIDGNGRVSRIMMNAELIQGDQSRIIVPTVFREDYLLALRRLSRSKDPITYIRVMEKLHKFSDNLYGNDFNDLNTYLHECNAYEDPQSAKLIYIDRIFNIKTDDDLNNVQED